MTQTTGIELAGVQVTYGDVHAVGPIDLVAQPGTLLALTGPSGAGKTSLLWAVAGALTPSVGSVRFDGVAVDSHHAALDAGIVLIPQGNGLARFLTARENVMVALQTDVGGQERPAARATRVLDDVGLAESGDHLVEELSGGQQQRVAVARGLAQRARVLLADESTSDLDPVNRTRVLDLLRAEAERGAVVIFATNDLDAAEACHAHLALDEGRPRWERAFGHAPSAVEARALDM